MGGRVCSVPLALQIRTARRRRPYDCVLSAVNVESIPSRSDEDPDRLNALTPSLVRGARHRLLGTASRKSSSRLLAISVDRIDSPVTLPPGRAKLAITPPRMGWGAGLRWLHNRSRRNGMCLRHVLRTGSVDPCEAIYPHRRKPSTRCDRRY